MAIILDAPSIELARRHDPRGEIDYLRDDFLTHDFAPQSFDLVASVAALHHLPASTALARMAALLRPGGRLAVVGLARARLPADLPHELAALLAHRFHRVTKAYWEHSAPTVWPPPETYCGMRRISARALPGARFRRHLLWRYSLVWTKPPPV
ncbi:MAG TPA: methyltransferase domain-containing protein [Pseudonocardia sp.]|uniref:class I SAM-dependent methyltransferase n=1 Tax=Pseudonocardia sp. TaxID=60912 RepID=UPI002C402F3F|nr:methyltransferase domain-containing protein [Pseudonocardia sp.]HTF52116.1 methyltransferase domain-containing protein [Pseudonocardia sp.]